MWNADTHEHLATMEGHTVGAGCLTLYGNKLFSAGNMSDHTIRVWNADTHDQQAILEGHSGKVQCLTLYGNSSSLVVMVGLITPSVCGMRTPTSSWLPWKGIPMVREVSPCMATSSSLLVVVLAITIRVWNAGTHEQLATLEGILMVCDVSPSIRTSSSVSNGDDNIICVWNADTHEHLASMEGHTSKVQCLTLYSNKLFSAGYKTIHVWNADTHEHLATMEGILEV